MNKTPLLSVERRYSPRRKLKTSTPTLGEDSPHEEIYLSQVPQDDGVYWAYDNPKLDEELHRKVTALDEASPTSRKKTRRSTPKLRLKIAGSQRKNNNNDNNEEAKEFLNQCFGDFIKKNKANSDVLSESIDQINETKDQECSNLFEDDEDEEEFLLLASQAIDSSLVNKKTPLSIKKDFNRRKLTDPFEDDSFDVLLSQLPEDAFNKSSPKSTKLSLKRHGTSEDIGTPKSSKAPGRKYSFRRNNSAPVIESPTETIPCTQEEIMKKKEAALKKRQTRQTKVVSIEPQMKQEIEIKRREALKRRNLLQKNGFGK